MNVVRKYVLGLDLGSASLGWACIEIDGNGSPQALLRTGVRIFEPGVEGSTQEIELGKDQSKAVNRRTARLQRRQLRRRVGRQRELFRELQRSGLLPQGGANSADRHAILNALDQRIIETFGVDAAGPLPLYMLRKRALSEPLQADALGRVLFHLSQRRGFLSNRKDLAKDAKAAEELGKVKEGIKSLRADIEAAGAKTLGAYFAGLDPHDQKIRGRWTARSMFKDEFAAVWEAQLRHHPKLLTPELRDRIFHLLFDQRPIAKQSHLIAACELEPTQQRAPWATLSAQRFRVLQKVNDLRFEERLGAGEKALSEEQRAKLLHLLNREGTQTFAKIKPHLGLPKTVRFNLERGDEKSLPGNRTEASMRSVFGDRWDSLTAGKQQQIVENWRNSQSDDTLRQEAAFLGLGEDCTQRFLKEKPAADYCSLSLIAIGKLMPLMEAGISFKEAEKEIYGNRFTGQPVLDTLPTVREQLTSLRNPAVERALTEMRKVVNALLREFGKPQEIRIELARELKKPRAERVKATATNRKREAENKKLAQRMIDECGLHNPKPRDMEKAKLWVEQEGRCPYTGMSVAFSRLVEPDCGLDVDHILPRSRYPDDSYQNKVLCSLEENRNYKRNQTPFEAYAHDEDRWREIVARVTGWKNKGKLTKFLLDTPEKLEEFTARQMNDTRHSSVLAARLLGTLYGGRDISEGDSSRQAVFSSSGAVTATLRRSWGFEQILQALVQPESKENRGKPRTDHRHHAIDAIVIALTGNNEIQKMARASALMNWQPGMRPWWKIPEPWTSPDFFDAVRQQIANMVVSHRPEHKISGELHKGSNYGRPRLESGKSIVHSRVSLASLSAKDIDDDEIIVDRAVRDAVRAKLAELGGDPKLFANPENAPRLPAGDGRSVPIRKVRIREVKKPLRVGQGVRERWVASGGIHHVELFVEQDQSRRDQWKSCVVQIPQAYERRRRKQPVVCTRLENSDAEFLFSLCKDDTVEMTRNGKRSIYRVKLFYDQGDTCSICFVPVNDAHLSQDHRKLQIEWYARPSTMKNLEPRKVVVDLLGRIHPAND